MSRSFLRTVPPTPCSPLYIKDLLKEDVRYFDGILIGYLQTACEAATAAAAAAAAGCCVSPPKQLSAPKTLYIGIKKLS
jgi:hypothetical protein